MRTRTKLLAGVGLVFLGIGAIALYVIGQNFSKYAMKSCISSVNASLLSLSKSPEFKLNYKVGPEWRVLNEYDTDQITLAVVKFGKHDCKDWALDKPRLDHWNNRLQISVRQLTESSGLEFRVGSKGPDGISGTSDDITLDNEP